MTYKILWILLSMTMIGVNVGFAAAANQPVVWGCVATVNALWLLVAIKEIVCFILEPTKKSANKH